MVLIAGAFKWEVHAMPKIRYLWLTDDHNTDLWAFSFFLCGSSLLDYRNYNTVTLSGVSTALGITVNCHIFLV
jgi:hypothetical protein